MILLIFNLLLIGLSQIASSNDATTENPYSSMTRTELLLDLLDCKKQLVLSKKENLELTLSINQKNKDLIGLLEQLKQKNDILTVKNNLIIEKDDYIKKLISQKNSLPFIYAQINIDYSIGYVTGLLRNDFNAGFTFNITFLKYFGAFASVQYFTPMDFRGLVGLNVYLY